MSSINRRKICLTSEDIRQSYSERICDDLSQVILQPLKDKFRVECLSKQFQRTIFAKPSELKVTLDMIEDKNVFLSIVRKYSHVIRLIDGFSNQLTIESLK